ncbi:hypothetical protein L0664_11775 [Octadecabacter sp. G9-8]|uniref:Uncharacterized protein n=1 Tax=Octadecabacter dasysiphoniae TaxID=2909341 RepID=A0ABS9CY38_9RHOB|nr:hypothetical protein [Octadecabacter dasysiphoniae]MCF2871747.1 hypothetical protein [Octadecabacter dasysiphoniae]
MTTVWTDAPRTRDTAQDVPLPKPQPFSAPVLIGDCVSPLAGETVLSLIWKRLDRGNQ